MANKVTKNERREHAREVAKQLREQEAKRKKRNRLIAQLSVVVGVIVVIVIVAGVVWLSTRPGDNPANMASNGIAFTKASSGSEDPTPVITKATEQGTKPTAFKSDDASRPVVVVYYDYMCSYCGEFEKANIQYLTSEAAQGDIDLVMHPVAILDNLSAGTQYSTRAANAAAAVANYAPDAFLTFHESLFSNQPQESSAGLSNKQLISYATQAINATYKSGASDKISKVTNAINSGTYSKWAGDETKLVTSDEALQQNNGGTKSFATPTVTVDGQIYQTQTSGDQLFTDFPDYLNKAIQAKQAAAKK